MTFEAAVARLEEVLAALESGEADLGDSLKLYEEGIGLVRLCTKQLENAERSVKILQMQEDGTAVLADFKGEA
ncbi:MAG: exodeoxyribonuclease VII small subunit [Clostridia bacterium]|nr:exodeoxyribonuclease VII small subunit [Clostridia bacterium]